MDVGVLLLIVVAVVIVVAVGVFVMRGRKTPVDNMLTTIVPDVETMAERKVVQTTGLDPDKVPGPVSVPPSPLLLLNEGVLAVLEILQGPDAIVNGAKVGRQVEIRDKWVSIGRNPRQATIQLYSMDETSSVSRLHCTLELHDALKCFFITDEGSSSGTKVAGRAIVVNKPHSLKDGDTIELGLMDKQGAVLRFHTNLNPPERITVESNIEPKTTIRQNIAMFSSGTSRSTEPIRQDVFISYSRKDRDHMHLIRAALLTGGMSVWSDESLEPGTPHWKQDVQLAIEGAGCVVAILSPDAKISEWVGEELSYARIRKLRIFTVLVRGDETNAIPFGLTGVQWIDMRSDYQAEISPLVQQSAVQQLVLVVQEHLGKQT